MVLAVMVVILVVQEVVQSVTLVAVVVQEELQAVVQVVMEVQVLVHQVHILAEAAAVAAVVQV